MISRRVLTLSLAALFLLTPRARAAEDPSDTEMVPNRNMPAGVRETAQSGAETDEETPAAFRWMLRPLKRGIFVRLPIIDTDPNRGITYGIMPIVVLQGKTDDRIEQIHAPSLTYNKDFKLTPTYRYYYYPHEDASFLARFSRGRYEHEGMLQYEDHSFRGTHYDVLFRGQKNRDAGQRFFGIGPDSPKSREANYIQDYWQWNWELGTPLAQGSPWRAHLSQRYMSSRTLNGPLVKLPSFLSYFPQQYSDVAQQTYETRVNLDYDTRDHAVTTSRGAYANAFAETSVRSFMSQYDYERYGAEGRYFLPWTKDPGKVFAVRVGYEQIMGPTPPFWLLPSVGGKYSLRAYGDGRYVDRGAATLNIEQRIRLYEAKAAGVTTEIQLAPFAGIGEVFDNPKVATREGVRPVFGAAIRAVARPQVVGSVDFGVGREGLSVFTDINYSF
jgi:hypothetical protein